MIELLEENPARFGFFQAVRLLEQASTRAGRDPVGTDGRPEHEAVRFRASLSLEHPASEIARLRPGKDGAPPEMTVSFMGLVGPSGVLPEHYTEQAIAVTRMKNTAFRDFLDMLAHRSISLFYRAWARAQLTIAHEHRARATASRHDGADPIGRVLASLVGLETPGLDEAQPFGRELALHHAGQIANRRRSALTVKSVAESLLERKVEIRQFQGSWLPMAPDARTRLPSVHAPLGQHAILGHDAVLGIRCWDVQAGFTIRVGPLSLKEFNELMPDGAMLPRLVELVRFIVGPAQFFSVQPVLRGNAVPPCRVGEGRARLGWNSWLGGNPEADADRDDALFSVLDMERPDHVRRATTKTGNHAETI